MTAQLFFSTDVGGGSFDVSDWIEEAKRCDASLISFAEYGGLQSTMRAYRKAVAAGLKYAPSMLIPFQPKFDKSVKYVDGVVVLTARNTEAYLKLVQVNNWIQRDYFSYVPRLTLDMLALDEDPISTYEIDAHVPVHQSKLGDLLSLYGTKWYPVDAPNLPTMQLIVAIRKEIAQFVPFFNSIYLDIPVTNDLIAGMSSIGAARFLADDLGMGTANKMLAMASDIGFKEVIDAAVELDEIVVPDGFVVPMIAGYGSYPSKGDAEVAAIHRSLCSKFARSTSLPGAYMRNAGKIRGTLTPLMSSESDSVKDVFRRALKNNVAYHESVDFNYTTHQYEIPSVSSESSEVMFDKLIVSGWNKQVERSIKKTYVGNWGKENEVKVGSIDEIFALGTKRSQRVKTEHDTFAALRRDTGLDFQGYFLICWDIIDFCDRNKLARNKAGRGSAPACLIGFLLGLFQIDPIDSPYYDDLLFERFINFARVKESKSLPDIDMDFSTSARTKVLNYLKKKYGSERIVSISTMQRFKVPMALRDLIKRNDGYVPNNDHPDSFFRIDPKFCTRYQLEGKGSIEEMMHDREIKKVKVESKAEVYVQHCVDASEKFEQFYNTHSKWFEKCLFPACNMVKTMGTHASACIIVPGDVDRKVPVRIQRDTGIPVVQFEMDDCEASGMVKLDLLGLKGASSVDLARQIVSKVFKQRPDEFCDIRFDDPKVFQTLMMDPRGIFQLGSDLQIAYMKSLKPTAFEDMVAALALIRTGPMKAGAHTKYAEIKNGLAEPEYDHPMLRTILARSQGVLYLQEQIMKISVEMAGFSAAHADDLRKAAAKKKKDSMEKLSDDFVNGCVGNGVDEASARRIWEKIEYMAEYLFNASHSVAYAAFAYEELYLKTYWPEAMWCGILEQAPVDKKRSGNLFAYKAHIERSGLSIRVPTSHSFHHSFWVEIDDSGRAHIMWPISGLRGIATDWSKKFHKATGGKISDMQSAIDAVDNKSGKKLLDLGKFKSLLFSGFFDSMYDGEPSESRVQAVNEYYDLGKRTGKAAEAERARLIASITDEVEYFKLNSSAWNCIQNSIKDTFGDLYDLSVDRDMYSKYLDAYDGELVVANGIVESFRTHQDKNKNRMAFMKIADKGEEYSVTIFASAYKELLKQHNAPKIGDIVEIAGEKSCSENYGHSIVMGGKSEFICVGRIDGWGVKKKKEKGNDK